MTKSYFKSRQKILGIAATVYLLLLIFSHWQLPAMHVWVIACLFSVLMNFTYLIEAISLKSFAGTEALVASTLISVSILGLIISPVLLIVAIFAHGVWDIHKHFGSGVPFMFWYTSTCFLVDTTYSSALLYYYLFRI